MKKAFLLKQIGRGIARDCELRQDDKIHALRRAALDSCADLRKVTGEVAHGRVDLGQGDTHTVILARYKSPAHLCIHMRSASQKTAMLPIASTAALFSCVLLPQSREKTTMNAPEPGSTSPKVRVLVADDEQLIASTLATILDLAGYEVCAVYGGEAALRLLDLFKPDLVITDVNMPGVTGVEVAFAARASLPRCRILLFSGHASLHTLLRANELEGLAFQLVTKPIHPDDLLEKLRDTLSSDRPALLVPIDVDEDTIH